MIAFYNSAPTAQICSPTASIQQTVQMKHSESKLSTFCNQHRYRLPISYVQWHTHMWNGYFHHCTAFKHWFYAPYRIERMRTNSYQRKFGVGNTKFWRIFFGTALSYYEMHVMSHMNESCHIWKSHATYECSMSHKNASRHDASRPHTWQDNNTILTVYRQVLSHA